MAGPARRPRVSLAVLAANCRAASTPRAHLRVIAAGRSLWPELAGYLPTDLQHRRAGWHAGQLGRIARAGACRTTGRESVHALHEDCYGDLRCMREHARHVRHAPEEDDEPRLQAPRDDDA